MSTGWRVRGALLGAALVFISLTTATIANQAPPQSASEPIPLTQDVFKNVMMLRDIPVDTFFETMGMFASAMGQDCTFCHASNAYFDRAAFAEATPRIMRARQMMVMTAGLNKQYFGGQARVTCFTCHGGSERPKGAPDLALQYSPPVEDPNAADFPTDARFKAEDVFDKYLQAIGGETRLGEFRSFTAKGSYTGFDTALEKVPVEIVGQAPSRQTVVVRMFNGESTRTFDGQHGWMSGPDTPVPVLTLTGGNLEGARLDAMLAFPGKSLHTAFPQWRVGRTAINDEEVLVVQGSRDNVPRANFYFDDDGMLIRVVRWTMTPVGAVPTQTDYEDYRDVAGIKVPFRRVVTQTYMQMTIELTEVQPNAAVGAGRFSRPTPLARPAA